MRHAASLFSLACLLSIASANTVQQLPDPVEQQSPSLTEQCTNDQAIILQAQPEAVHYTMVKGTVEVQEAGMFGFFYQAECCGGGWNSPFLKSPALYLSLAFIALLYVKRRSIMRALRRHHVATA